MTVVKRSAPRVVIAGVSGDSGKTAVSLALIRAAARQGVPVRAFKKGPDYIDPAWLSWACGAPAYNLDSWLMGPEVMARSFARRATPVGLNVIEGNRGLFDGVDTQGTHSTAELAKTLGAPVVVVLTTTKMTRTAAAVVLGCQQLDPKLGLAGVILNRVNGRRHEHIVRTAIEENCGIPVVGVIPQYDQEILPHRHLGLVTPEDYPQYDELDCRLGAVSSGLDVDRILQLADSAGDLTAGTGGLDGSDEPERKSGAGLKIAYLRDAAFSFYYADNLEALERSGVELVPLSSFTADQLPSGIDALYIGGGFPEVHAARISSNHSFLRSLRNSAEEGLPIYAECGGLILLSRSLLWQGTKYNMAGIFDLEVEIGKAPQGHGYVQLRVDRVNPFFPLGMELRGHEFHYSRLALEALPEAARTACAVGRGVGIAHGRDALLHRNVWASYTHLHAAATPRWVAGFTAAARRFQRQDNHEPSP